MDTIRSNLTQLQERINRACERSHRSIQSVKLVAITKNQPPAAIRTALELGLRDFGENRIQEAKEKIAELADLRPEFTWHMVGHIQTNKAKLATSLFAIIHSVDSVKLARLLSKQADRNLPVLLQVNVSGEPSKSGFTPDYLPKIMPELNRLPNLTIAGLMTMAPLVDDPEDTRPFFHQLRQLRDRLELEHLSMGMTDDFEVAIEEGATMIRIGRAIFKNRRG